MLAREGKFDATYISFTWQELFQLWNISNKKTFSTRYTNAQMSKGSFKECCALWFSDTKLRLSNIAINYCLW